MNGSSILNIFLMLSMLGLALDASANLINCNKASAKWFEPVTECEDSIAEIRNVFNFFPAQSNSDVSWWSNSESFFLTKDDLNSAQFIVGSLTNNQLAELCVSGHDCSKGDVSLIRNHTRGAIVRVSEPAPMLLVLLGLLGLGVVRRRLR